MKRLILGLCLIHLFCGAQEIPSSGFDKVRIVDETTIIQAELLPVKSVPAIKPDRFYYWYGSNILHSTQGGFAGKLLNGTYKSYFNNKGLKEQGTFKDGLKDGLWQAWNIEGFLTEQYKWKDGFRSGTFFVCDSKGIIIKSGTYRHNQIVMADTSSFWRRINIFKKKSQ